MANGNLLRQFDGASHADVERVLRRAMKEMVLLGDGSHLTEDHIVAAYRYEKARTRRARTDA